MFAAASGGVLVARGGVPGVLAFLEVCDVLVGLVVLFCFCSSSSSSSACYCSCSCCCCCCCCCGGGGGGCDWLLCCLFVFFRGVMLLLLLVEEFQSSPASHTAVLPIKQDVIRFSRPFPGIMAPRRFDS